MAVLYRKYRPQTFSEVVNQKFIIQTLKNQVASGQIAHAYLFTGSRGVGKTTVARLLAKAVNCEVAGKRDKATGKSGEPCGKCKNCQAVADGSFLDMVEIDAASNTGVDNIRDLIEHVKFSPTVGKYKVFIVDEVHMLSKGAFNALLKTLEEPPKHAIFILATTEINKVPATIISRTQRFDFKRLGLEDLEEHLAGIAKQEKVKLPKEVIQLVARNAEGSGRDALSLLDKILTLGEDVKLEDALMLLGATDVALSQELLSLIALGKSEEIPAFVDKLLERGTDLTVFNRDFLEYLRMGLVYKVTNGAQSPELESSHKKTFIETINLLTANDLMYVVRLFLKSYKEIGQAPMPDVPVLLAALEAALRKSTPAPVQPARPQAAPVPQPSVSSRTSPAAETAASEEPKKVQIPKAEEIETGETTSDPLDLEEIKRVWHLVIDEILKINGPLAHLVKNSPIQGCEGTELLLGVKYLFHKENIHQKKNQEVIRTAIEKICGKKARITAVILAEPKQDKTISPKAINDALAVFGGELVQ